MEDEKEQLQKRIDRMQKKVSWDSPLSNQYLLSPDNKYYIVKHTDESI